MEMRGRPTVTIVEERFEAAARLHAQVAEMPELPLIVEETPTGGAIQRDAAAFAARCVDEAVRALTEDPPADEAPGG
jgi:hypothetical protein